MDVINNVRIDGRFFLAPMRAVNISSFRKICENRGASLVFSQMVDVDEFYDYSKEYGIERAKKRFVNINSNEKLIVQFIGRNIEKIIFLIDKLKNEVLGFDLNAGCPMNEYLGKKVGAYFVKNPQYLYKTVRGIREQYDGFLSVKLRSGWDENSINIIEIAEKLKELDVDMLCIHPRTKIQGYSGHSDWSIIAKIKKVTNIPIALSGDVFNVYDAYMAFLFSKADYIMIGRCAKAYPSIFTDLNNYFNDDIIANIDKPKYVKGYYKNIKKVKSDLLDFLNFYEEYEDKISLVQLKQYIGWFFIDINRNKLLNEINQITSYKEIKDKIKNNL